MLQIMVVLIGVVLMLAMLLAALSGPSETKIQKRRVAALRERHSASAVAAVEAQLRRITNNRATRIDSLASNLLPRPALLKKRLDMTGRDWSLGRYALVSLGIALAVALLVYTRSGQLWLALLLGLLAGLGLPHMVVGSVIKKRIGKFNARFPDAIELLVRGLRAGLPISETLAVVATEIPGPTGEEFRAVSDKMKIGRSMDVALQETADRLGTPEFQFFCITLAIQRETGGNLAETLANLADVLRKRAQMKLKIRAMSSESKASAYIVGSLPFIVFTLIWMINPEYLGAFFIDQRLMVAGIGGLIWMSIGAFIMAKMVSFEI